MTPSRDIGDRHADRDVRRQVAERQNVAAGGRSISHHRLQQRIDAENISGPAKPQIPGIDTDAVLERTGPAGRLFVEAGEQVERELVAGNLDSRGILAIDDQARDRLASRLDEEGAVALGDERRMRPERRNWA